MILLVTTSSRAKECAAALEQGTGQQTQVANSVPQAVTRLQTTEYDALAIDQSLLEADFRALVAGCRFMAGYRTTSRSRS